MAFNKYAGFNKKFIDDRVDYPKVLEMHLINLSNILTHSNFDQSVNYVNAVEGFYTLAHPLLNEKQFEEIDGLEQECNEEIEEERNKRENKNHRFLFKAKENEIKRKYAEKKMRIILKHIRHMLISESISAVEDEVPDNEDE